MNRFCLAAAVVLAGTALRGAEPPPPAPDQPPPQKAAEASPQKADEAPASTHRLGGAFKGHPMATSGGSPGAAKPASKPATAPSGKKKTPTLVIDNAMVKGAAAQGERSSPPPAADSAEPAHPASPPPVEMPKILDLQGHDEGYWKAKAAATRDAVVHAQETLAAAEAEEKREENDFYAWDDGQYRDSVIKPAWDRAKDEAIKARTDLDAAQKTLGELEDEARRAGAYPGWIR